MWAVTAVLLTVGLALSANTSDDPKIPTTVDKEFIKFQKAVGLQQTKSSVQALYGSLDDYKDGFEDFKTTGAVNTGTTGKMDPDFDQFQTFITKHFREYNNMDEFVIRYNLFKDVLSKSKGYHIGGDLVGINRLSDKTHSEKKGHLG